MKDPDYLYDPDDWEYTCNWGDRVNLTEDCKELRRARDIKKFNTLIEGPPVFAAKVPTDFDEDGEPAAWELQWFDSEARAREACGMPPYITGG